MTALFSRLYGAFEAAADFIGLARQFNGDQGAFTQAIKEAGEEALDWSRVLTHRWSGTLAASHQLVITDRGFGARIEVGDLIAPNGASTLDYGPVEFRRGGEHAYYQRVIDEHGDEITAKAVAMLERGIRRL